MGLEKINLGRTGLSHFWGMGGGGIIKKLNMHKMHNSSPRYYNPLPRLGLYRLAKEKMSLHVSLLVKMLEQICPFQNRCYVLVFIQYRTVCHRNFTAIKTLKNFKKCRNSTRRLFFFTQNVMILVVMTLFLQAKGSFSTSSNYWGSFFVVENHSMKDHCSPSHN